jgi:hypothetical protein
MVRQIAWAWLFGLAMIPLLLVRTASADTQYFAGGNGWGKTYRNNYVGSGCYNDYGTTSACYQGTWAETFYWEHGVSVYETPQIYVPSIPGDYSGPFHYVQKSGISNVYTSDVSVGSDYDALFKHRVDSGARTANQDMDDSAFVYTYDE